MYKLQGKTGRRPFCPPPTLLSWIELILREGTRQALYDTILKAEAKHPNNFTQSGKRFVIRFLFVNATKVYQFEAKDSEIKDYVLVFGNDSKDVTINSMRKTGLKAVINFFSIDFNPVDTNNILYIHKYLMKIRL